MTLTSPFRQNTPQFLHSVGVVINCILVATSSVAAACVPPSTVFGHYTNTILAISVAIGVVGGSIKLAIASIGGNVNPNNITSDTANATVDMSKPTTPAPAKSA